MIVYVLLFGKEISFVLKDWMWYDLFEINCYWMFKNFLYICGCNFSYLILIFLGYFLFVWKDVIKSDLFFDNVVGIFNK